MLLLNKIKTVWIKKSFLAFLKKILGKTASSIIYTKSIFIIKVLKGRLLSLLKFLNGHVLTQYKSLIDIIAYDILQTKDRFVVIYNLLSVIFNARLWVCVYTHSLAVPSVCSLYPAANWLEREV
jgi:NADH:ubiquinone oxidoreductase subunit C